MMPCPHQKRDCSLMETLAFICIHKMNSVPNFFSKDIVKILQTSHFEYFENAWSCPSIIIVSPCRRLLSPHCWNQVVGNFYVYLHAKKQLHHSLLSWSDCKLIFMWQLQILSYFNIYEKAVPYLHKFVIATYQITKLVTSSSSSPGVLYTNTCSNKI